MQDSTAPLASCFPPFCDKQAVAFPLSLRKVDAQQVEMSQGPEPSSISFAAISANVCALGPRDECQTIGRAKAARALRLDHQWNQQGIVLFAGLQEARTEAGRFQSEHYRSLAGGALPCLYVDAGFSSTKD